MLEEETARVLAIALAAAKKTICDHREIMDRFIAALFERETIETQDLAALLGTPAPARPA